MLLAAVVAVLAMHLLDRAGLEVRLANRSHYLNVAMNLAEAGVEDALWSFNNTYFDSAYFGSTYGWSTATDGTDAKLKTITTLALSQGTGEIYIRVDHPFADTPIVYVLGVVRLLDQPPIVKQLRVALARRALWANAIVAKSSITFNGNNVQINGYNSALGPWNAISNNYDQANVATTLTSIGGLSVNNADIYGSVATGGAAPVVGANGSITGATTPVGVTIDPTRVRADFSFNLRDTILPSASPISLNDINYNLTLPRAGDTAAANGRYLYRTDGINLTNKTLTIDGPVDLIVTDDVSVGGSSGSIVINAGTTPSLNLYVGDRLGISASGGINNTNKPTKMVFYGTRTTAEVSTMGLQSFSLGGSASYVGIVYAPNASVTLNGGGTGGVFNGAVIANTATFTGNYVFHYDIQLLSFLSDQFFRPNDWMELTDPAGSGALLARDNRQPFNTVL